MTDVDVAVTVNGRPYRVPAPARRLLSDYLRHDLRLTGTHVGCEQGVCGACTVLVDGAPVRSCLLLAAQVDGCAVETVEGLGSAEAPAPLQQAMLDCHGLQCGFCTPGLLMSLTHAERAGLSSEEVTEQVLPGHLCRCTGYVAIRAAIEQHWQEVAR